MSHHINFTDFWPPPLLSSFPFLPSPSLNCMLSLLFNIGPWSYLNEVNVTEMYQFTSKFVNIHVVCKLQFYNGSGNWVHNSDVIHVSLLRSFPAISVFDKEFCCQQSISCTTIPKNHLTYSLLAEMQCFKALWTKRPGKSWSHYIALARRCVPPKLTLVGVLESFFFRSLAKMQIAGKIAILWIINDHLSEK